VTAVTQSLHDVVPAPKLGESSLRKTEFVLYLSHSVKSDPRGLAGESRGDRKMGSEGFGAQRLTRVQKEADFFIPIGRNPLKSLDSEK
jgi:hypothetical protein